MNEKIIKVLKELRDDIKKCRDYYNFYGTEFELWRWSTFNDCMEIIDKKIKEIGDGLY